jgi:5-bromo-4-chloroindolyl phosphate hydrolysis protein
MGFSRQCTKCGKVKWWYKFSKNKEGEFGLRAKCKACLSKEDKKYYKGYYKKNKEKISSKKRNYYRKNKEKICRHDSDYYKRNRDIILFARRNNMRISRARKYFDSDSIVDLIKLCEEFEICE